MKVTGFQVLDSGDKVHVMVADDSGNQVTYQYGGTVYSTLTSNSKGDVSVYLHVTASKASNSPNTKFDS
jgi:hypothetical protein